MEAKQKLMKYLRTGLLLYIFAAQTACFMGANQTHQLNKAIHPGCELTLQSNTFAGLCGDMVLFNSGSAPMHGWDVEFDLPDGEQLHNTWNAKFTHSGNHWVVQPLAGDVILASGASMTFGYCASSAAEQVTVTAGQCATPTGLTAALETAPTSDAVLSVGQLSFTAVENATGGRCDFDAQAVEAADSVVQLHVADDPGEAHCGALRSTSTYLLGRISARVRAATQDGITTGLATAVQTAQGVQQIALEIDGGDLRHVRASVWRDGIVSQQMFEITENASGHVLAFDWQADGITWYSDGNILGRTKETPRQVAQNVILSTWLGAETTASQPISGVAQFADVAFLPR